jgi:hypothetical protein
MSDTNREQLLRSIQERASQDPEFRAQLLSQPRVALGEMLDIQIPEAVNISVYEETPTDVHFVIPADSHLDEEDLELVAGGVWQGSPTTSCRCN